MRRTVSYLITGFFLIFLFGYAVNKGLPLIFSLLFTFLYSLFAVTIMNIVIMTLMDKGENTEVDKNDLPWIVSHNKLYKYPTLVIIWISQLSLFSYFIINKDGYGQSVIILLIIASIISSGLILLGRRT